MRLQESNPRGLPEQPRRWPSEHSSVPWRLFCLVCACFVGARRPVQPPHGYAVGTAGSFHRQGRSGNERLNLPKIVVQYLFVFGLAQLDLTSRNRRVPPLALAQLIKEIVPQERFIGGVFPLINAVAATTSQSQTEAAREHASTTSRAIGDLDRP